MRRVLFIKLGAIGDVIMAMAGVHRFLQENRDVRLTWMVGNATRDLVHRFLPDIDLIGVSEEKIFKSNLMKQAAEIFRVNLNIFSRWESVVTAYRDRRYDWLSSFGISSRSRNIVQLPGAFQSGIYHGEAYYHLLNGEVRENLPPIHPGDIFNTGSSEIRQKGRVGLAPGGAKNLLREDALRRLPIATYRRIAERLINRGVKPVIIGAKSDEWVISYFQDLEVEWQVGTLSLVELCDFMKGLDRVVTHDSGILHLALLSNIAVTAFFGPTRADEKVPRNVGRDGSYILQAGRELKCSPCYDGRSYADCSNNLCLQSVNIDSIPLN